MAPTFDFGIGGPDNLPTMPPADQQQPIFESLDTGGKIIVPSSRPLGRPIPVEQKNPAGGVYLYFGRNDLIYNRLQTHPQCNFYIYDGDVFYRNFEEPSGSSTPTGYVNLYELNVHRGADVSHHKPADDSISLIYPFIPKGADFEGFKTISQIDYNEAQYGSTFTGSYPLTASIESYYYAATEGTEVGDRPRIQALKNVFNFYKNLSPHYTYSSSYSDSHSLPSKDTQEIKLISIPSIFYGSSIKKGTVDLKFYRTGSLMGRLKDTNRNGELIQYSGTISDNDGKVAGVVLYNEGFLVLTASWPLSNDVSVYKPGLPATNPSWVGFGITSSAVVDDSSESIKDATTGSLCEINFSGTQYVSTMTMFAHAPKGMFNNSMNPTYIEYSSSAEDPSSGPVIFNPDTGSNRMYLENPKVPIKNIVKSQFSCHTESFEKHTYISKIGIYDEYRNLIAIAKVSKPIKKTENRDFTFKLRLDY